MLTDIPQWLDKHYNSSDSNADVAGRFWDKVRKHIVAEKNHEARATRLKYDKDGIPTSECTDQAYQLLMDSSLPFGLNTPDQRRAYFRHVCLSAENRSNPAHVYLASLLDKQRQVNWGNAAFCRTILTTNFDHLLQKALQIANVLYYVSDRPETPVSPLQDDEYPLIHLVYTHGSIHRKILRNTKEEINDHDHVTSLRDHFERHGVIVMGYGGWNDIIMSALESAEVFGNNLFWCSRHQDSLPDRVKKLLEAKSAYAFKVDITDADQTMATMYKSLSGDTFPEILTAPISCMQTQLKELVIGGRRTEDGASRDFDSNTNETFGFIVNFSNQLINTRIRLAAAQRTFCDKDLLKQQYIQDGHSPMDVANACSHEAVQHASQGDFDVAIELWTRVIEMPGSDDNSKAVAFYNRALSWYKKEDLDQAISDYSSVLNQPGVSEEIAATALVNRGATFDKQGDHEKSIKDYTAVTNMPNVSGDQKALAYHDRGYVWEKQGHYQQAISDYTNVTELEGVSTERLGKATHNRAAMWKKLGELQTAIEDFTNVITMENVPVEVKTLALNSRGDVFRLERNSEKAIRDFTNVVDTQDAPVIHRGDALLNRALCLSGKGV